MVFGDPSDYNGSGGNVGGGVFGPKVCPTCNTCPTCGRSVPAWPYNLQYPSYPQPLQTYDPNTLPVVNS